MDRIRARRRGTEVPAGRRRPPPPPKGKPSRPSPSHISKSKQKPPSQPQPPAQPDETPPASPEPHPSPKAADEWTSYRVVARCRPLSDQEESQGEVHGMHLTEDSGIEIDVEGKRRVFRFHQAFGPESSQRQVYEQSGLPNMVEAVLDGCNACVLAYGQTGAGKTYTIIGPTLDGHRPDDLLREHSGDGMMTRLARNIFISLNRRLRQGSSRVEGASINAQALEVYNEMCYDMLSSERKPLKLRHNPRLGIFHPEAAVSRNCTHARELLAVMHTAARRRVTASHQLNLDSSRSHLITIITLRTQVSGKEVSSRLIVCDLAGSERLNHSHSQGKVKKETLSINKSLHVLRRVIAVMSSGKGRLPPVRDSTLTKLLADCLISQRALILLIANVTPASVYIDESIATLRYAAAAQKIVTQAEVAFADPRDRIIARLKKQVKQFKAELDAIKQPGSASFKVGARRSAPSSAPTSRRVAQQKYGHFGELQAKDSPFSAESLPFDQDYEDELSLIESPPPSLASPRVPSFGSQSEPSARRLKPLATPPHREQRKKTPGSRESSRSSGYAGRGVRSVGYSAGSRQAQKRGGKGRTQSIAAIGSSSADRRRPMDVDAAYLDPLEAALAIPDSRPPKRRTRSMAVPMGYGQDRTGSISLPDFDDEGVIDIRPNPHRKQPKGHDLARLRAENQELTRVLAQTMSPRTPSSDQAQAQAHAQIEQLQRVNAALKRKLVSASVVRTGEPNPNLPEGFRRFETEEDVLREELAVLDELRSKYESTPPPRKTRSMSLRSHAGSGRFGRR